MGCPKALVDRPNAGPHQDEEEPMAAPEDGVKPNKDGKKPVAAGVEPNEDEEGPVAAPEAGIIPNGYGEEPVAAPDAGVK